MGNDKKAEVDKFRKAARMSCLKAGETERK